MELENLITFEVILQLWALFLNVLKTRQIKPNVLKIKTKLIRYKSQQQEVIIHNMLYNKIYKFIISYFIYIITDVDFLN
jgi:hypothetical protein